MFTWRIQYYFSFMETPRKFIIAKLSIRKLGSSSIVISTDEDPSIWMENFAVINLRSITTS